MTLKNFYKKLMCGRERLFDHEVRLVNSTNGGVLYPRDNIHDCSATWYMSDDILNKYGSWKVKKIHAIGNLRLMIEIQENQND